jgi:hypothetical protein
MKVDFENRGLYYEPRYGSNWWEYYFEPIAIGNRKNAIVKKCTWEEHKISANLAYKFPRKKGYDLIQKHIKVKPFFLVEIEKFIKNHFNSPVVIGIHYRGTDKVASGEAHFVSYDEVAQAAVNLINEQQLTDYQIFIATDEWNFIEYMHRCFPNRIIYQECRRSSNNQPIHTKKVSPFQTGKEALLDALLLARCHYLIRTRSSLSVCSSFFNPFIPVWALNEKN